MTVDYGNLTVLQATIGAANRANGFHAQGDELRRSVAKYTDPIDAPHFEDYLRNYYITKLALITSEAVEGIEELRVGRAADEAYHNDQGKPEGVPSEVADIVIRAFDFADEAGFDLGAIIEEKLRYNATRGKMHGGKRV